MDYIELLVDGLSPSDQEILTSRLAESGFESFMEEGNTLLAYIPEKSFIRQEVELMLNPLKVPLRFIIIPDQNWNAEWEKSYQPVMVSERCHIRAPFHPPVSGIPYEIIIEPKMSFGTAHHETTAMMIELMLDTDFRGKNVLDMGSGTGVLAILAAKMGAGKIIAIDNDEWAFRNSIENTMKNNEERIHVIQGDAGNIPDKDFNVILANINRNILVSQIPAYWEAMLYGTLLMSGFYVEDIPVIRETAERSGFSLEKFLSRNRWVAVKFNK